MEFNENLNKKEVGSLIHDIILSKPLSVVKTTLDETFLGMESVIEMLYIAISMNKNAILYGPGGFGKSEIVKAFCDLYQIPTYTIVGFEDMEVESLLGIPNIQALIKQSEYKIAFDKTVWVKPGILILEEFLDARPGTAAALKDILSSGGFNTHQGFIESKITSVIICSNKNPKDVSVNESLKAFYMERFPFQKEVKWISPSSEKYLALFQKTYSISFDQQSTFNRLAKLCSANETLVSPRIALNAAEALLKFGWGALEHLEGIDISNITLLQEQINKENKCRLEINRLKTLRQELKSSSSEPATLIALALELARIAKFKVEIESERYFGLEVTSMELYTELLESVNNTYTSIQDKLINLACD